MLCMFHTFPHLRRSLYPLKYFSYFAQPSMERVVARVIPLSLRPTLSKASTVRFISVTSTHFRADSSLKPSSIFSSRVASVLRDGGGEWKGLGGFGMRVSCVSRGVGERGYRRSRKKVFKSTRKERELELSVKILIEEGLPNDPEILSISEMLQLNAPKAMKLALERLKESDYKTRDTIINDVGGFETIELSILLCNDEFIQKLNKDWRDEDHATDVLSMSQHIPELQLPILMLGDIVISVETAARQAEARGHTLLDEIRILLVHGLLHLLGFDHEISEEAEVEMEKEEELLLEKLAWKGKGLIKSANDVDNDGSHHVETPDVCS